MMRNCVVCGETYSAQRPQSKYCGQTCRKRRQRSPEVVKTREFPAETDQDADSGGAVGLVESVRHALTKAKRMETTIGQQALLIAERMSRFDTGGGTAALSRELRAIMAEALREAAEVDPVDELNARRDAKRAG